MKPATASDFWALVVKQPNGCWIWCGAKTVDGYGQVKRRKLFNHRNIRAHHYSWYLTYGEWPSNCLCHHCDNPSCVNPDHLFLGTYQDNMDDRVKKKRHTFGENNGNAKLDDASALEIVKSDLHPKDLARKYGVKACTIYNVLSGKRWKHIFRDGESDNADRSGVAQGDNT